jgi:hypothetical protein
MLLALRHTEGRRCTACVTTRLASCVDTDRAVNDHAVMIPDQFMTAPPSATDDRWQLRRVTRSCLARGGI